MINKLYLLKICIRIICIIVLINPEDGIKFFVSNIGNVVGVPDGHVNKARSCAIKFKGHYFICSDAAQFNYGSTFDHSEAFGFAGVEMVAADDAGDCC